MVADILLLSLLLLFVTLLSLFLCIKEVYRKDRTMLITQKIIYLIGKWLEVVQKHICFSIKNVSISCNKFTLVTSRSDSIKG